MKKLFAILFFLSLAFSSVGLVLAAGEDPKETGSDPKTTEQSSGTVSLNNPLGDVTTVPGLIGKVIKAVVGIVGSLALLMFIYGGFTWMLSGGNSNAVERGKNILMWAAIGLVIIFMSYAIVNFIITKTAG